LRECKGRGRRGGGLFVYCTADFLTTLAFKCDTRFQRLVSFHGSHAGLLRSTVLTPTRHGSLDGSFRSMIPKTTRFVLKSPRRLASFYGFHAGLLHSMNPTAASFVLQFLQPICEQSLQISAWRLWILMLGTSLLPPSLLPTLAPALTRSFCLRVDEFQ
jgi:hypothetical protein